MAKDRYADCSHWDYEDHPQVSRLKTRCRRLEKLVRRFPKRFERYGLSTKRGHRFMFFPMVPAICPEIAGNYRGLPGSCLEDYQVMVRGDDKVGTRAAFVDIHMGLFEAHFGTTFNELEQWKSSAHPTPAPPQFLARFIPLLCLTLEEFFRIHPYANGNGHAGRLLLFVLMVRHGFDPKGLELDESPAYGRAIHDYRRGKRRPLEDIMLKCFINGRPFSAKA